jgi:hypothetical protein
VNARTLVYAGIAVAVAGSGFAATGAQAATHHQAKKKKLKPCTTWTDPAGDAYVAGNPGKQLADPTLDITGVTFTVAKGVFTAKVADPKYSNTATYSDGNQFDVDFTVGGKTINIFVNRGVGWTALSNAFAQQGFKVGGAYTQGSNKLVTTTAASGVVTLTVTLADLATAAGVPLTNATASAMSATSWGDYEAESIRADTATAPATAKFVFADCK